MTDVPATPVAADAHTRGGPASASAPRVPPPSQAARRLSTLLLAVTGLVFAVPMLWLIFASFDANASWSIQLSHFTLGNFRDVASSGLGSLRNSLVLATVATLVATVSSTFAGYALSRRRIPWKGPMLLIVLFLSGVPMSILIVPIYQLFSYLNWLSLVPAGLFLGVTAMPFEIWLIKNFMDAIPYELEEAARIEKASTLQILLRVVGPLALPGIGAGAIYAFVNAWGSFVVPLVLINNPAQQPGPVAIYDYIGSAVVRYGDIAALSVLYSLPVFVLYGLMSKLFAGGFTLGGAMTG